MHATNRIRLMQIIDFAKAELKDLETYKNLDYNKYKEDKNTRRIVDRIIENVINALIDISKIIISEKKIEMPDSYAGIMEEISSVLKLNDQQKTELIQVSKLRNILAHEYMDIKFEKVKNFISNNRKAVELAMKKASKLL